MWCTMVTMRTTFLIGGIGSSAQDAEPDHFLMRACAGLQRARIVPVPYDSNVVLKQSTPQPFDFGGGLASTRWRGKHALADKIRDTDDVPGIWAYSAGALAASDLFADMARGEEYTRDLEVAYAVLAANPGRARIDPHDQREWFGISGEHGPWPPDLLVREVHNPEDIVPNCPPKSPARWFAALGEVLTLDVDQATRDAWSLILLGLLRRPDPSWLFDPDTPGGIVHAITAVRNYGATHGEEYFTEHRFDPVVEELNQRF